MIKAVSILGSTGSIGRQSIAAAKHLGVPVAVSYTHLTLPTILRV